MNTLLRSSLLRLVVLLGCLTSSLAAQTTSFTYQGRLTDGGASASGPYDLQFKLYDAVTAGNQIGASVLCDDVNVTNGVFSTTLDFGATAFPGAARWLEISVRPGASTGAYITLTPRQPVNSTPYAIRALSAETVTGPVPASQLTGTLPPGVLPAGGAYINNSTTQQAASNFNISGNGTAGGTLSSYLVETATQYNLNGQRILTAGLGSVFVGPLTGASNSGLRNTLVGNGAGYTNTTGEDNAFVGVFAGGTNVEGSRNTAFGNYAGYGNKGSDNALFGHRAGYSATGNFNAFFGAEAGRVTTTGGENAFFGARAGNANTTGSRNTFLGNSAAPQHTTGDNNTFVGNAAGFTQTSGSNNTLIGANANVSQPNLTFATAIGAGATVYNSNNLVLGRTQDTVAVFGSFRLLPLQADAVTPQRQLCINSQAYVIWCSSSQRYKTNVQPLQNGLAIVNQLRPVTFDWKSNSAPDLGFIAEEVAAVEPLLAFRNAQGVIEGVNYNQISAVLVNAVKEQQAQIEQLKKIVCADHPNAAACQSKQQ